MLPEGFWAFLKKSFITKYVEDSKLKECKKKRIPKKINGESVRQLYFGTIVSALYYSILLL